MIPFGYRVHWDKPCPDLARATRMTLREWSKNTRLDRVNFWQAGHTWLATAQAVAASHTIVHISKGGITRIIGYIEPTCAASRTGVIHLLCQEAISPELVVCCQHFLERGTQAFSLLMAAIPRHFRGVRHLAAALGFVPGNILPKSALHMNGKLLDTVLYFREAYEAARQTQEA